MASEVAAPPKSGKKGLIVGILLALAAGGGGASLPWIMGGHAHEPRPAKKVEPLKTKQAAVPFGDVVVNLGEDRLNRYLRVKVMVAVDKAEKKEITELLDTQKPFLKNWLICFLSDQSTQEVTRKVGVNRIRREIREHFNAMLYP